MMRRLELDELAEHSTLLPDEAALLRNKSGATRLGFALLLKFVTRMGRFPSGRGELADDDLPRAFRTADLWLIHAADCCSRYSSWTCCGVRY